MPVTAESSLGAPRRLSLRVGHNTITVTPKQEFADTQSRAKAEPLESGDDDDADVGDADADGDAASFSNDDVRGLDLHRQHSSPFKL